MHVAQPHSTWSSCKGQINGFQRLQASLAEALHVSTLSSFTASLCCYRHDSCEPAFGMAAQYVLTSGSLTFDSCMYLFSSIGSPTCSLTRLMSVNHFMTGSFACNLTAPLQVAPQLGHLGVQGCLLGASGLTALAALSGLQCLSLSISSNTPHTLTAITCLSHLTALQVGTTLNTLRQCTLCPLIWWFLSTQMVDMGSDTMPCQSHWCMFCA